VKLKIMIDKTEGNILERLVDGVRFSHQSKAAEDCRVFEDDSNKYIIFI
jgi:hypothetical protein